MKVGEISNSARRNFRKRNWTKKFYFIEFEKQEFPYFTLETENRPKKVKKNGSCFMGLWDLA